jgi:hypothetical protein
MRSKHLAVATLAQRHPAASRGGDPVFAGIHILPPPYPLPTPGRAGRGQARTAAMSPGHDVTARFNMMTGPRSNRLEPM